MRVTFSPQKAGRVALAAVLCASATPASAFLGIFGKKDKVAPETNERQNQEYQATAMLREARQAQTEGRTGRAQGIYGQITKLYPFTVAASEAAFANAMILRQTGGLQEAFDAFQDFIEHYRSSPRFDEAIRQQYELAEIAKGGKKERSIILIPFKMGGDDVAKLYGSIIRNAPYGKLAPLCAFSIGEIYQDLGDKERAVAAYQTVVDNYPNTKQAVEANFRIGSVNSVAAARSEDKSNIIAARDAWTTYMENNPKGERKVEAEMGLRQMDTIQAQRTLDTAKYYYQQSKNTAASIYLLDLLQEIGSGSPDVAAEARQLLAEITVADPDSVNAAKRNRAGAKEALYSSNGLKNRDSYVGPMSPEQRRLGQSPQMRSGNDNFLPIPLNEPTLPTKSGSAPNGGALLPPISGDRPMLEIPVSELPGLTNPPATSPPAPQPAVPATSTVTKPEAPKTPEIPPKSSLPVPPKPEVKP